MFMKGIDISSWQGNLTLEDFLSIKNEGINFVIIRCGFTSYGKNRGMFKDKYFENNYKLAKEVGLNVGTYYYSCAVSENDVIKESHFILGLIKNKQFEYPIVIDTEDNHDINNNNNFNISQYSIGKDKLTNIILNICKNIENKGYYVSIYASSYWLNKCLNLSELSKYDKWVAQWSNDRNKAIKHGIWQYSSTGKLNGINGYVDLNYSYLDYPKIIKDNNLNGFVNKYNLIINYLCDNEKIKESIEKKYFFNEKYEIIVPNIDGYEKTVDKLSGIIIKNEIVNIMYNKKNNFIDNKKDLVTKPQNKKNIFIKFVNLIKKIVKFLFNLTSKKH